MTIALLRLNEFELPGFGSVNTASFKAESLMVPEFNSKEFEALYPRSVELSEITTV